MAQKKATKKSKEIDKTLSRLRDGQPPVSKSETEESDAWFKSGSEGFAESRKQAAARKMKYEKGIRRFYLKAESSLTEIQKKEQPSLYERTVVFVDSKPFFVDR